jgi:hypothetical protein
MTRHAEFFAALAAPFKPREVKQLKKGKTISYVTARTVMNRLDEVVGPEGWWDDYFPHENSVICRLTIVLPDGKEITKVDAGGYAGMSDSGDDDKSGFSDAFKRAAVKFGVSRYLYEDGVPNFAGERAAPQEQRPPAREPASRPAGRQEPRQAAQPNGNGPGGPPRNGKALYAWVMEQEKAHEIRLLQYINNWAKLQELPGRMVDWDAEQVAMALAEATRKIEAVAIGRPEAASEPKAPVASTKEAQRFESALNAYCQRMNAAWLDKHTNDQGEIPDWVKDIINPFQVVNHMLKASGVTLPAGGNFNERMKAAAKLWLANESGVTSEWNAYLKTLADELHKKHAEAPEAVAVGAGREPGSDDE